MKKQAIFGEEKNVEMGTIIRPKISEKNRYWIEKHRYYELKHFCLQYSSWKKTYLALDGLSKKSSEMIISTNTPGDPTAKCAIAKEYYSNRIQMIEQAAIGADAELYSYILKGVTEGLSYTHLKANLDIPCSKDTYYDRYRRFFWLLHNTRN